MPNEISHSTPGQKPGLLRFASFAGHAALGRYRRTGAKAFFRDFPTLVRMGLKEYQTQQMAAGTVIVGPGAAINRDRPCAFDVQSLLSCPDCGAAVRIQSPESWICAAGSHQGQIIQAVPHFHRPGETPMLRMSEPGRTHPYGPNALELLNGVKSGLALDFGAGSTPENCLYPNVVYLDVQQFRFTDVVSTTDRLPFRDGVFELVVSQAVFEHLEDPHGAAREILRILKPGGTLYIDTAFMQPLHADPSHYFNMTLSGIRKVMAGFEEVRTGVAFYQNPSFGWAMQLDSVLPIMAPGFWKDYLVDLRKLLDSRRNEFDDALGERGREILAAGYFYQGRKPLA
jgi:SAM-dependent methyltransferase